MQCIGEWSEVDKHDIIRNYVDATRAVRAKYLPPRGAGGAAFIDLFAGPGRARVKDTGEIVDGTTLIAVGAAPPFTRILACDLDDENVDALHARTRDATTPVEIVSGDCNEKIAEICKAVPRYGLNVAVVDPFSLSQLKFATLERLARFDRMDLIIHFPTGSIKRNLANYPEVIDEAVGTREWRTRVRPTPEDVPKLIGVLREQLQRHGYTGKPVLSQAVRNSKKVILYHLIYAAKNARGDTIWNSLIRAKSPQRPLF